MPVTPAFDVFISHSSSDKLVADAVCHHLEAAGRSCWTAPRDVAPGQSYGSQILQAIENSRSMVVVLSANSNASKHVRREIERAVSKGVPIIPLRIEDIVPDDELEYFLASTHWLDAMPSLTQEHLAKLVAAVTGLLDSGTAPAATHTQVATPPTATATPAAPAPASRRTTMWVAIAAVVAVIIGLLVVSVMNRPEPQSTVSDPKPPAVVPDVRVTATGVGLPPEHAQGTLRAKYLARRAATVDALRNCAAAIRMEVRSSKQVDLNTISEDRIEALINAHAQNATITSIVDNEDGSAEATVEVTISRSLSITLPLRVTAVGYGLPNEKDPHSTSSRLMAEEVARLDAASNCAEKVKSIVTARSLVVDGKLEEDAVNLSTQAYLNSLQVVSKTTGPDGVVEMTVTAVVE